jgi:hypothetical protein
MSRCAALRSRVVHLVAARAILLPTEKSPSWGYIVGQLAIERPRKPKRIRIRFEVNIVTVVVVYRRHFLPEL